MHYLDSIFGLAQAFPYLFRDHYRAVLSTGATECDGEVAFAFLDVVRQQIYEQVRDALDEFLGLGKRADVPGDLRIPPGERPEGGNKMWIGQEADIEEQVSVVGYSMFKAEADA